MSRVVTYKKSGVNVDLANRFVEEIKPLAKSTRRPEVVGGIGGFGALFRLPLSKYKRPVLVSSTDGVGTKLMSAKLVGKPEVLGADLVAMNVNDIVTCGAEPLFFLDYFAIGKLDIALMKSVIQGIADACKESGCALIGGETAEMPGVYPPGEFDLAGFVVGVVEQGKEITGKHVTPGDVIIGCASNGIHANGFSMVRKVFDDEFMKENADEIIRPTRLYVRPVLDLLKRVKVKAMAHITGGGFYDNIPRVLAKGTGASIHAGSWKVPTVFKWLSEKSKAPFKEMYRTFNMGIGYIIVVSPKDAHKTLTQLGKSGVEASVIGEIVRGSGVKIR